MIISIGNVSCTVTEATTVQLLRISKVLTCFAPGYRYSYLYKLNKWDGRVCLFENNQIPTGLIPLVLTAVTPSKLIDERGITAVPANNHCRVKLRDYQLAATGKALFNNIHGAYWPRGVLKAATGAGKTQMAAAMIQLTNLPTLFLVDTQELLTQAFDTFRSYGIDVGTSIEENRKTTVLTIQSLMQFAHKTNKKTESGHTRTDEEVAEISVKKQAKSKVAIHFLSGINQLFVDECHGIAASVDKGNLMYRALSLMPNAYMRWGLTATPFERDNYSNFLLEGATGSIICEIGAQELIKSGYLAKPLITIYKNTFLVKCPTKWPECYKYGVVLNDKRNDKIVQEAIYRSKPCIVLVSSVDHGVLLQQRFARHGHSVPFINGKTDKDSRKEALVELREGRIPIAIASEIYDAGIDVPNVRTIILAGAGASTTNNKQRIGRGMRISDGKTSFEVIDFYDGYCPTLRKHSNARHKVWVEEGYDVDTKKF